MKPEIARFIIIQNKNTGEIFSGLRGKRYFENRSAATNSFNEAHRGRMYSGKGKFQAQDEWVHRTVIITQDNVF